MNAIPSFQKFVEDHNHFSFLDLIRSYPYKIPEEPFFETRLGLLRGIYINIYVPHVENSAQKSRRRAARS